MKICVLLCFFYVVIVGNILTFQWFSFGSNDDATSSFGNHFDGYDMIKESQAYARTFGELTDETIQRMVRDYQRLKAEGKDREREWMDRGIIDNWLETLWPELKDSARYETMITYVDADQLTGLYERRQQAVEDFLKISGQTGGEQEYLLKMESKVQKPFRYQWVESWSQLLGSILADLGMVMALFLAIVLSPLFAGEWHSNTGGMILATRNGWRQAARTKIMVGFAFTLEFFTLLAGGMLTAQLFFLGFSGWDMPIQTIKLIAVAPINMLGAELYEYGFTLLGVIGYAGVVMLISAAVRNHILAALTVRGIRADDDLFVSADGIAKGVGFAAAGRKRHRYFPNEYISSVRYLYLVPLAAPYRAGAAWLTVCPVCGQVLGEEGVGRAGMALRGMSYQNWK